MGILYYIFLISNLIYATDKGYVSKAVGSEYNQGSYNQVVNEKRLSFSVSFSTQVGIVFLYNFVKQI